MGIDACFVAATDFDFTSWYNFKSNNGGSVFEYPTFGGAKFVMSLSPNWAFGLSISSFVLNNSLESFDLYGVFIGWINLGIIFLPPISLLFSLILFIFFFLKKNHLLNHQLNYLNLYLML